MYSQAIVVWELLDRYCVPKWDIADLPAGTRPSRCRGLLPNRANRACKSTSFHVLDGEWCCRRCGIVYKEKASDG